MLCTGEWRCFVWEGFSRNAPERTHMSTLLTRSDLALSWRLMSSRIGILCYSED